MSLINVKNLTFAYDGSHDNIFENVSFMLDTDWRLGLTGRNGRGKTTFLKLLMGKYPFSGSISADVEFEYFPYEVAEKQRLTLEIITAMLPDIQEWEIVRELNLLKTADDLLYRSFETLSNGEQTKVLLAALFLKHNRFLLIDEPTNHLDMEARAVVGNYLRQKSGFILVSHDRALLDGCINHIMSVNKSDIDIQKGNFSSWWQNKERQDSFEQVTNDKLKKHIKRLEQTAKQKASWSDKVEKTKYATKNSGLHPDRGYVGHKAQKMMKRAKSLENRQQSAIEEKSKLLKNIEFTQILKIQPLEYRAATLIGLEKVTIHYSGRIVCPNISFSVKCGDRIALCGANGSGKSSLLKLILNEDIPYSGNILRGSGLKISYVRQDASWLSGNLSEYAREQKIDESLFKAILRKLDFSRIQFEKDMCDFSAGQKKKVLIARSLCEQAHLYIWDEPLNFIDVYSRIQIETLLKTYQPTVLFVEHDRAFGQEIATKTVQL
ncbi:ribosomal protection-like ABC-F family protein [Oscillospiraceae bacterium LTW-04]|nr:ABC-F type ribosomal protection protein [Oscillospiraceae bacterium MB24-C1]